LRHRLRHTLDTEAATRGNRRAILFYGDLLTDRHSELRRMRTREHLTSAEVDKLIEAAKRNRWGQRDAPMALMAYRHGFRASELVDLQ
jgi:integrase